jgi:hypothetical protein
MAYCTNSLHKDGKPYQFIGTKDPITLTEEQAKEFRQHIDNICKRHALEYLDKHYRG